MFKDELNIAFENVRPAPELLDRISAMMSEEANRKKAPLQMRAVRYAGIAAAVALAAGGTMLAVNNANNGVKTSSASYSEGAGFAAAAADASPAAVSDTENDAGMKSVPTEELYDAGEAAYDMAENEDDIEASLFIAPAEEEAADEDGAARIAAAGMPEEALPAETLSEATAAASSDISADEGGIDEERTLMKNADSEFAAADEAADIESPFAPDMEMYSLAGTENYSDDSLDMVAEDYAIYPAQVEEADYAEAEAYDGIAPAEPTQAPAAESDGAAKYELTDTIKPTEEDDPKKSFIMIESIRDPLWNSVDPGEADAWYESFPVSLANGEVPDSLESYPNVYTFIKHFGTTEEQFRQLMGYMFTDEQIYILYHGTVEEITSAFASPLSIVRGDKIYSQYWIMTHNADDYAAAGITGEEIEAHKIPAVSD